MCAKTQIVVHESAQPCCLTLRCPTHDTAATPATCPCSIGPEDVSGVTTTILFRDSVSRTSTRLSCGANQELNILSAELGKGLAIKVSE
jgi:hypothetical protein